MDQRAGAAAIDPGGSSRQYRTGEATKFTLIGPGTATISQGTTGTMSVSAPDGDFEHLEVEVNGDALIVSFHGGLVRNREPQGPIHYVLSVPVIEELKLSGALAAEASNMEERDLKVELKGGSSLALAQYRAAQLDAKVEEASRLTATGTIPHVKVKLAAKSTFQAGGLESVEVEVDAAGGSDATVRVSRKLKAKADGGSTISYSGAQIDLNVTTTAGSEFRQVHI